MDEVEAAYQAVAYWRYEVSRFAQGGDIGRARHEQIVEDAKRLAMAREYLAQAEAWLVALRA